jgi:hypothetical protein
MKVYRGFKQKFHEFLTIKLDGGERIIYRSVRFNHRERTVGTSCINTINPLQPNLVYIIFKNSVRTAKKTQHFTITKINWLTLFKEIIAVYGENHTKHINTKYRVNGC